MIWWCPIIRSQPELTTSFHPWSHRWWRNKGLQFQGTGSLSWATTGMGDMSSLLYLSVIRTVSNNEWHLVLCKSQTIPSGLKTLYFQGMISHAEILAESQKANQIVKSLEILLLYKRLATYHQTAGLHWYLVLHRHRTTPKPLPFLLIGGLHRQNPWPQKASSRGSLPSCFTMPAHQVPFRHYSKSLETRP